MRDATWVGRVLARHLVELYRPASAPDVLVVVSKLGGVVKYRARYFTRYTKRGWLDICHFNARRKSGDFGDKFFGDILFG